MSVMSSKRRVILKRLHSMTDDAGIIKICEDLCSDAERSESIAEERKRQISVISAENSANEQKCAEFTIQIARFRENDIEQRKEIGTLRSANGDYRSEIGDWADRYARIQGEYDRLVDGLADMKQANEEEGRQKAILVASFKGLQDKYGIAEDRMADLEIKPVKTQQLLGLRNKYTFGTDSEKTDGLFGWRGNDDDPLSP